jgi:hypothetical protein
MDDIDLSLVAALRNEQYGGDLFARARSFLRNVAWLTRHQSVRVEVILVEWCPLADREPLAAVLGGSDAGGTLRVRIVTVPTATAAERFEQADVIPLWIFAAKNVGIRRARAPFVLATNPDVLYTPALFGALRRGKLDEESFYRTSRHDVTGVPLDVRPRTQLARCRSSVVRVNLVNASLHFDPPVGGRELARAIRRHTDEQRAAGPVTTEERAFRPTEWLHTNASGDFFLMHRRRWKELHGYPEFASAGHLDSYMCAMAASLGLRQVILDGRRRLYHLEHPRAIDWEHPETAEHYYVPYETFLEAAREMLMKGEPTFFNDDSWGLAELELPETTVRW